MSFWLKRMETFLESVDQTAATQISSLKNDEIDPQSSQRHDNSSPTYSQPTRSNTLTPSKGKPTTSTTPAPKPLDDNDIFKFLNDSDSTPPPSSAQRLTMPAPKPKKELKVTKKTINTTQPTKNTTQKVTSIPPTSITPPSQEIQQPPKKVTPPSSPKKTEPVKPTLNEKQEIETKKMEPEFNDNEEKEKETEKEGEKEKEKEIEDIKEEKEDKVEDTKESVEKQEREETQEKVQEELEKEGDKEGDDDRPASPLDLGEKDGWGDEGIIDEKVDEEVEKEQQKEIEKDKENDETTKEQEPKVKPSETQPEIKKEEIQLEEKEEKGEEVKEVEKEDKEEKEEIEEKEEKEEKEEEREEEQQEEEEEEIEEEEEGGLDAEFVQKYNDLITQNEKLLRENKLMRQEVVKLHEEIQSQSTKSRATAEALSQMTEVLSEHQKKAHEKDKQVIKLKQQEQELETALHAKDMQIAGSRAQFEQVEKTLRMREATLTQYQERIEKLIQEKEDLLDGNQRANFQIQNKVDELDKLMQDEKRTFMDSQRQAKERETELQAGLAEYTKALALTQRNLDEKTLEYQRTTAALKEAQNESKTLRQELVDYKLRATKVLQSKEKAIQEMTERLSAGGGIGGEGERGSMNSLAELVRVQQEHDVLQQERDDLSRTVEQLRNNLQDVQTQAEADSEVYHSQLAASEEALERERKRVQTLQIDLLTRSNESVSMQGEAEKTLSEAKESLKTKDAEIARLKKQLASKSQSSSSQMELENRLRSTTDHLLQKQAQIDTLLSEKSFLQLQLENTIQRERHSSKSEHIPINIKSSDPIEDEHEEPRIRHRPIASLVPVNQPNFVSQRVVRAANFLDTMSASAGRIMRIYPGARLAVIAYVFMIHLMGFYILASWNPEVHGFEEDTPPTG